MRLLLEQAEISMAKTNHKAASMEAELNSLRCQVLTLRYQLDAVDATDLTADVSQPQQVILSIVGGYQFECFGSLLEVFRLLWLTRKRLCLS